MKPILTAAQMREADRHTIEDLGLPGFTLMETAGRATAREIAKLQIDGVKLHLTSPVLEVPEWVGQREVLMQLLASWTRIEKEDLPLRKTIQIGEQDWQHVMLLPDKRMRL